MVGWIKLINKIMMLTLEDEISYYVPRRDIYDYPSIIFIRIKVIIYTYLI